MDDNTSTARDWIERHLHLERWNGDEAVVRCPMPAHADEHASAGASADRRAWHCHGCGEGGKLSDLASAIGVPAPVWNGNGIGGVTRLPSSSPKRETARWAIRDRAGELLRWHVRVEDAAGDKECLWYLADGNTPSPKGGTKSTTLPCYGIHRAADLPDRRPATLIFTEGEKAADALTAAVKDFGDPLLILGTVTGSGSSPTPASLADVVEAHRSAGDRHLREVEREPIYLWPDRNDVDKAGRRNHLGERHMAKVGAALVSAGVEPGALQVIDFNDGTKGCDAAEWVDGGCSPSITELMQTAVAWEPPASRPRKESTRPDNPGGLPEIAVIPGTAASWKREAVKAMVAAGPRNDLRSLYASPVTATATGETTGGVTLLRTQPQVDVDSAAKWSADADGGGAGGAVRWPAGELVIEGATDKAIKTILEGAALWLRPHPRRVSDLVPTDPTDGQAADVIEMYRQDCGHAEHPRLRLLRGIVDAPTLRADGTLLAKPGYDRQSGLYADFNAEGWKIPTEPTQEDARVALAQLHDVVQESPFATPEHRAVWVAGLLTIVGREYARGNVPLFAVSANNRGAGKGTLVDMATAIATGRPAAKWAPTGGRRSDAEAEEDKRLTTVALNGTRVLLIDNVKAGDPVGTPSLDRAMTAGADGSMGEVSGRLLGKNIEAKAPWRVVVWATGNNLVTRGDLDRRVLLCRLHTDMERPEERRFHRQSPVDYCIDASA